MFPVTRFWLTLLDNTMDNQEYSGVVIRSTGSWYTVRDEAGNILDCRIKGKFRIKDIRTTNPVAVGDHVVFTYGRDGEGMITTILDRHNYIIRKATKMSRQSHILAANIDQAVLIATLAQPRTSSGFMDRFLVTAEAYHIPARIVFNKMDLYDTEQQQRLADLKETYEAIGYECLGVSALRGDNLEAFRGLLQHKVSLLAGHSGVGKSALINAIQPELQLRTGEISSYHSKGRHTTTFAEMHPLSFGGYIIDTPGIKEFGLVDFDRREVWERFPEMRALMHLCRFTNCTHVHEPGCAVRDALDEGRLPLERYINYLSILNDDYWEETESDYDK